MTGKAIAANLKGTKLPWGKGALYDHEDKQMCVLGIKAYEAGVPKRVLNIYETADDRGDAPIISTFPLLIALTGLNDGCESKQELINRLLLQPEKDYPVEAFIAALKKWWAQYQRAHRPRPKRTK